ncbi:hypothetical protein [Streptomyces sp. NBC_00083]|uniref:hypothetical protein n=1 Tax=Streptomyces sp. NBC_00083 TaxID=2975647 RepID=UPI0022595E96|nr:hypothetical protein [Streptomyces sp. NBC_00083]MCX5388209.1 hypothetical protein [Streptomyces sp. NBC_00083]
MPASSSSSPAANPGDGCMVGLFWVTGGRVYVGTPPGDTAPGVLLSPVGVRVVGDEPRGWRWAELLDVQVDDVPVRSTSVRWATHALTVAAAAFDMWAPDGPGQMTVALTTKEGERATAPVLSGAAVAYSQREVDLSLGLLARFVRGELSPSVLSQWWDEIRPGQVLRSREREAVLEGWFRGE